MGHDYNNDEDYVDTLLRVGEGLNEGDRYNIAIRKVTLTGNIVDDSWSLVIARDKPQTLSEGPAVSSSRYSDGYESGQHGASQAISNPTSVSPPEEDAPDEDIHELGERFIRFEEDVINAARTIALNDYHSRLIGLPSNKDECIEIMDDFEWRLVDFFQEADEQTAYRKKCHLTRDTKYELREVIQVRRSDVGRKELHQGYVKRVTLGQQLFLDELRRIVKRYTRPVP